MKSKELITELLKHDPSGEMEVSIDNHDIYFLEVLPAYWDGYLQRMIIDEAKKPYYSIVGAKVVGSGYKLALHTMGVEDVMVDNQDMKIDLSDLRQNMPKSYEDWTHRVEKWREEIKCIDAEIEAEKMK